MLLKPGTRAWFLEIALVCTLVCVCVCVCLCVCVCVCPPPRPLITSGVMYVCVSLPAPKAINNQWRDMVWYRPCVILLNKLHGFTLLLITYFIWHLPLIKWIGVAILTQHIVNAYQRKLRWHGTSYKRITRKTECFIYKSEWANV